MSSGSSSPVRGRGKSDLAGEVRSEVRSSSHLGDFSKSVARYLHAGQRQIVSESHPSEFSVRYPIVLQSAPLLLGGGLALIPIWLFIHDTSLAGQPATSTATLMTLALLFICAAAAGLYFTSVQLNVSGSDLTVSRFFGLMRRHYLLQDLVDVQLRQVGYRGPRTRLSIRFSDHGKVTFDPDGLRNWKVLIDFLQANTAFVIVPDVASQDRFRF